MMSKAGAWMAAGFLAAATASLGAQQPVVVVDEDDITIRGCVGRPDPSSTQQVLVWTRGDIMLGGAVPVRAGQPGTFTERVFYWLEDDDDLSKHIGQMVEVKGELGKFEQGELEFEREGEFTEIELRLGGKTEKARVPSAWIGTPAEGEVPIVSRKIDVDEVRVVGPCTGR
jgi:hypothetical protein